MKNTIKFIFTSLALFSLVGCGDNSTSPSGIDYSNATYKYRIGNNDSVKLTSENSVTSEVYKDYTDFYYEFIVPEVRVNQTFRFSVNGVDQELTLGRLNDNNLTIYDGSDIPQFVEDMTNQRIVVYKIIDANPIYVVADSNTGPIIRTLTFDPNGGTGYMASVTIDVIGSSYQLPECTFTAPEGYEFKCWRIGTTEYDEGDSITVYYNLTISAVWQPISGGRDIDPPTPPGPGPGPGPETGGKPTPEKDGSGNVISITTSDPGDPEVPKNTGKEIGQEIYNYQLQYSEVRRAKIERYFYLPDENRYVYNLDEYDIDTDYTHNYGPDMMDNYQKIKESYTYKDENIAYISMDNVYDEAPTKRYWPFDMTDYSWGYNESTFNTHVQTGYAGVKGYAEMKIDVSSFEKPEEAETFEIHLYSSGSGNLRYDYHITSGGGMMVMTGSIEYRNNRPYYTYTKWVLGGMTYTEDLTLFEYSFSESRPDLTGFNNEVDNPSN